MTIKIDAVDLSFYTHRVAVNLFGEEPIVQFYVSIEKDGEEIIRHGPFRTMEIAKSVSDELSARAQHIADLYWKQEGNYQELNETQLKRKR